MRQLAKLLSRVTGSEGSNPSLSATPLPWTASTLPSSLDVAS
jgi:hypothetical protein